VDIQKQVSITDLWDEGKGWLSKILIGCLQMDPLTSKY